MQIVEYGTSGDLTQAFISRRVVKSDVRTHEDGVEQIDRILASDSYVVRGYNEEFDYYWSRKKAASVEGRRVLRVEA